MANRPPVIQVPTSSHTQMNTPTSKGRRSKVVRHSFRTLIYAYGVRNAPYRGAMVRKLCSIIRKRTL